MEMDPRRRVEETWEGKLSYSSRGARLVVVYVFVSLSVLVLGAGALWPRAAGD